MTDGARLQGARWRTLYWWILAVVFAAGTALPFIWMVATSFKTEPDAFAHPLSLVAHPFTLVEYAKLVALEPFGLYFLNSAVAAVSGTLGVLITSTLAGYAVARLRFRSRTVVFFVVLGTMMIPTQVTMIPSFLIMRFLGWINTYWVLTVPYLVSPFGVFIMRQAFSVLPRELEEAAEIDGCGRLRGLWSVFLPNVTTSLATVVIFTFTAIWNDFFWPLVMTSSSRMWTLQVGLASMQNQIPGRWPIIMAGTFLVTLPMLVIFLMFQRYFVQGYVSSGLK